mgnify:CR=1 FL=1
MCFEKIHTWHGSFLTGSILHLSGVFPSYTLRRLLNKFAILIQASVCSESKLPGLLIQKLRSTRELFAQYMCIWGSREPQGNNGLFGCPCFFLGQKWPEWLSTAEDISLKVYRYLHWGVAKTVLEFQHWSQQIVLSVGWARGCSRCGELSKGYEIILIGFNIICSN